MKIKKLIAALAIILLISDLNLYAQEVFTSRQEIKYQIRELEDQNKILEKDLL